MLTKKEREQTRVAIGAMSRPCEEWEAECNLVLTQDVQDLLDTFTEKEEEELTDAMDCTGGD